MAYPDYSIQNNSFKSNPYLMMPPGNLNTEIVNGSQGVGQAFAARQVAARSTGFSDLPKNTPPVVRDGFDAEQALCGVPTITGRAYSCPTKEFFA